VLRALKDLEFERSVGKISDDDYQQLLVAYRAEAKRLLRAIDESAEASRKRAAEIADAYLAALGLGPKGSASEASPSEAVATEEASPSEVVATEEASPSEVVATEEAAIASAPADPEAPTDTDSDEGGSKEIPRVQPSDSADSSEVAS
jgi:hypothetical protein